MADPAYIVDGVLTDGEAWVGIAHETLSLPAATVTWLSTDDGQVGDFSQYMDMKIICYAKGAATSINGNLCLRFNNDATASIYDEAKIRGNGSAVTPQSGSGTQWDVAELPGSYTSPTDGSDVFGAAVIDIFDINSGKYKTAMALGAAGDHTTTNSYLSFYATTWKSQAAITEIDIFSRNLGNFVAGCTFSLFGILPRMVA
tara:strand:+ start:165 stop:767 length:603 start_codon:yes stop_codon:yes gene_type:complete